MRVVTQCPAWRRLLYALLMCMTMTARASECAHPLEDGLAQHAMQIQELRVARGLRPTEKLGTAQVAQIQNYADVTGSTFLLYVNHGDGLCVYRVAPGVPQVSATLDSLDQIAQRLQQMQVSLRLADMAQGRAPVERGARARDTAAAPAPAREPFAKTGAALADAVVPAEWQSELQETRQLIVLPAGVVGVVPFSVLPMGSSRAALIDSTQVSVIPGLQARYATGAAGPFAQKDLAWAMDPTEKSLIVGNPLYPTNDPKWIWPNLPGAEKEAIRAADAFPNSTRLMGALASIQNVLSKLEKADYLYFATHGMSSTGDPLNGGFLVLSDGQLSAREIQGRKINASLVVLSACQTGLGAQHNAGIIGLSRAFQLAGAPSVVMSLWSVNDTATAMLMDTFAARLKSVPPDLALHEAMLATRERFPDASHWGAFTHFGWPLSARMADIRR